jgi:hypothetical protein
MTVSAPRIAAFSLLALVLTAAAIEMAGVIMGTATEPGQEIGAMALALPAFWSFLIILFASVLLRRFVRFELITRPELLCVLFTALLAAPLMSVGFWRYLIPSVATFPRSEEFEYLDTQNPKLWPHGANLTEGVFADQTSGRVVTQGQIRWETLDLAGGRTERVPVIEHTADDTESTVRISVPLAGDTGAPLILGESYLLSVLSRTEDLALESVYYCRVYYDENTEFDVDIFTAVKEGEVNFIQREGFLRAGTYGLVFPRTLARGVVIELGLKGSGRVAFRDLQLMNTEALEGAYRGRAVVSETDFERMPEKSRSGLMVRPDRLLSLAGLRYLATAYVPWREWHQPMLAWGTYLALILAGTFAVAVIMRREWIDNQRFPLPMAQIPLFFLSDRSDRGDSKPTTARTAGEEKRTTALPNEASGKPARLLVAGWFNRSMWAGFGVTFIWCALRGWHDFNAAVPDLGINVRLQPYFSDPGFGHMWSPVAFKVFAVFLGLSIFLEINVLMSLIVGYFLYRAQYWFGEAHGLTHQLEYPYVEHQQLTAYLVYAALLLFFTRKYFWQILLEAVHGEANSDEVLSSRGALLLLVFSTMGVGLWAHWMSMPVGGMLILYATLLSVGFVAMKLRAECGVPSYAFFPTAIVLIVGVAGGMEVFGVQGTMFAVFVSAILGAQAFFLIPGIQLEFLELGRIFQLKRRIFFLVNIMAISGGFLIGGWSFLSGAYAKGIDWLPDSIDFRDISHATRNFNPIHSDAIREMQEQSQDYAVVGTQTDSLGLGTWITVYAGTFTAIVTGLRYIFAGFWFHPIGIILGPMGVMDHIWGSLLVAWVVRLAVLKLAGAAMVRDKLFPFFAGIFLAGVTAKAMFFAINLFVYNFTDSKVFQNGMF